MDAILQDVTVAASLLPMQNTEIGNKMNFRILHDEFFVLAPTTPVQIMMYTIIKYSSQDLD